MSEERILVPTDLSDYGVAALRYAAMLREPFLLRDESGAIEIVPSGFVDFDVPQRHVRYEGDLRYSEVLALVLELFRGAGEGWTYRPLRTGYSTL